MASTLSGTIRLQMIATITGANAGFATSDYPVSLTFPVLNFTNGSLANQASKVYAGTRTLAATTTETLDLYGGLTDPFGVTLNFTRIIAIALYNTGTNVGDSLTVGAAASNAFESWTTIAGSTVKIGPGGLFLKVEPSLAAMAVANGSTDSLKVANTSSNSIDYLLQIIGS